MESQTPSSQVGNSESGSTAADGTDSLGNSDHDQKDAESYHPKGRSRRGNGPNSASFQNPSNKSRNRNPNAMHDTSSNFNSIGLTTNNNSQIQTDQIPDNTFLENHTQLNPSQYYLEQNYEYDPAGAACWYGYDNNYYQESQSGAMLYNPYHYYDNSATNPMPVSSGIGDSEIDSYQSNLLGEAAGFDNSVAFHSNNFDQRPSNSLSGIRNNPTNAIFTHGNRTSDISYSDPKHQRKRNEKGKGTEKENRKKGGFTEAQKTFRTRIQLQQKSERKLEYENQREALIDQLISLKYECMVCCGNILRREETWSCTKCYHIFHLYCIKKWASSSAIENCWRCPGCQNVVDYFPKEYVCFCGKTKNPSVSSSCPHSCMQVCGGRNSSNADCTHQGCSILCHPGPCPVCTNLVKRDCECGKTSAYVQCSSKNSIQCSQVCHKLLNCNIHTCQANCHPGDCKTCEELITINCHCGKSTREVTCSADWNSNKKFSCDIVCDKLLNCRNHNCPDKCCLPGCCKPCPTSTDVVISCPCGQTPIDEVHVSRGLPKRSSCLDPISTCDKTCRKILPCGGTEKHYCQEKCHLGKTCPPCQLITHVMCRCGNQDLEIPCSEFLSSNEFLCNKKCTKKRKCGRHKCNTICCPDLEHICPIVCNRQLKCPHKCELLCHMGYCPPCRIVSFEELTCECGAAVTYPPVPCGTLPPPCTRPCTRQHSCDHPPNHTCHSEPTCPPCTMLTSKWCFGNHELRKNVLCHILKVSCGMPCNKDLNCFGGHKCTKICHDGPCKLDNEICRLPCLKLRSCGHKCGARCHEEGKCPDAQCKVLVPVTCNCGRRDEAMICWKQQLQLELVKDLKKLSIEDSTSNSENSNMNDSRRSPVLDCDKECARLDRNRKLAEALQLENPDPETRLGPPNYSEFLRKFAQKNPQFVEMVHTKLTDLVMSVKKSKKNNVTYAFDSMNRDKRTVIHEYSDHFGCASESFDEEPNRNVIVTASRDRCWLPSESLVNVVFCKTLTTERKNVYQDLELSSLPKSNIIGPANGRLTSSQSKNFMVSLNGSTGAWGKH